MTSRSLSPSSSISIDIDALLRSPTPPACPAPEPQIVSRQSTLTPGSDDSPRDHWGVPSGCLMSLSPNSDVSLKTFYKQITEAYTHNRHVLEEYEEKHPRPEPPSKCLHSIPDKPNVHERWHREFGTSLDTSSDYQEATVGENDVFGRVSYLLVYPAKYFRRDDEAIECDLEDRLQKKRTQLWIEKLQDEAGMRGDAARA
ncbi:hypothetical protein B0H10DRAFT_2221928 [Mycena sp. CBHHK59/15]|nr:hypothetical protein B0H10DRAFT_2221928 [Mycena sp. CBHHK59/15]